eukprot:3336137-Alexandrium_andersonii.AAC.1
MPARLCPVTSRVKGSLRDLALPSGAAANFAPPVARGHRKPLLKGLGVGTRLVDRRAPHGAAASGPLMGFPQAQFHSFGFRAQRRAAALT